MSPDAWASQTVDDLGTGRASTASGPFGSNLVSRDYTVDGVPVIRGENVGKGRWVSGPFVFVSEEKAVALRTNLAVPGDLVFTQRGTLGQVALIPHGEHERYALSQSQMRLRPDSARADGLFLYYLFSGPEQQEYIRAHAIQTGVPHTNLGILRGTPLRLPPIEEQRAIASVLGALDDKIELNRRMNETLEALARAIFSSWFVDFDPVRARAEGRQPVGMDAETAALFPDSFEDSPLGPIPSGWQVSPLDRLATFLNGLALQRYPPTGVGDLPAIKIPELRARVTSATGRASAEVPAQYVVADGDVLFSWSGSLVAVLWSGGVGALNQHLFRVTSKEYPRWLYYFWIREHLEAFRQIAAGKATTMGHIQRGHLSQAMCVVPSADVLRQTTGLLEPLLEAVVARGVESRSLATMREALLAKLISGEVRLDVQKSSDQAGPTTKPPWPKSCGFDCRRPRVSVVGFGFGFPCASHSS